jgi:uncharacterized protein YbjT (DUF2867 family)
MGDGMKDKVVVTGATGVLGKAIVKAALAAGLNVRQAVRNQAKADPTVAAVRLDYADPTTIAPALAGASAIVLMAPPLDSTAPALLAPVIAAVKAANLQHIVLISALGVNHNEQAPLRVVEHLVMDSGVPFTTLRLNFLMENFSEGFLAGGIRGQHAIHLAAGDGKTSFISARDVAAAVVAVLQQPPAGKDVDLTGPAALDHAEAARTISEASGRPVTYHSLTEDQMLDGARSHGVPEPVVAYMGALYAAVRAGLTASVSDGFHAITARIPMTFETFARGATWA